MIIQTIADLKITSGATVTDQFAEVLGYYTPADGGGGNFYWDGASVEPDNQGTVIQVTGVSTGRWKRLYEGAVNLKYFGAKGDGTSNDSVAFQKAVDYSEQVHIPAGTYKCNVTLNQMFTITGDGSKTTILQAWDVNEPVITYLSRTDAPTWNPSKLSALSLQGFNQTGIGFSFGAADIANADWINDPLMGRVSFDRITFAGFDKGILKQYGNIGNVYSSCRFFANNYGILAMSVKHTASQISPIPVFTIMHAGCDVFYSGEFDENLVAGMCVLDNTCSGTGQWLFYGTVFQNNRGFGLFFDFDQQFLLTPVLLDGVWEESNGKDYTSFPLANVTIQTLTGTEVLVPETKLFRGLPLGMQVRNGDGSGFNTWNPKATVGAWGEGENCSYNAIAGGFGAATNRTRFAFSQVGYEDKAGAFIDSEGVQATGSGITATDTERSLVLGAAGQPYVRLATNGGIIIGKDGTSNLVNPSADLIEVYGNDTLSVGDTFLQLKGNRFAGTASFHVTDNNGYNGSDAALKIGMPTATNRSINAGGTINANGLDYAEYMTKAANCRILEKGDICGVNADGELTDHFKEAVSFVIKSTDPSFVGGDSWTHTLGEKPVLKEDGSNRDEVKSYQEKFEIQKRKMDRISFSGQVPVNVYHAKPGDHIIPTENSGKITGVAVSNPTFEEYQKSVGKVWKVLPDGKAWIAVKIG